MMISPEIALAGFGIVFFIALLARSTGFGGTVLAKKFRRAGTLEGKTREEVLSLVGPPSAVSVVGGGQLLQWQANGYHIALKFGSDDVCVGVVHEAAR